MREVLPEIEILLLAARARISGAESSRIQQLVAEGVDWTVLVEWALWHHVTPNLHRALQDGSGEHVPGEIMVALRDNVDHLNHLAQRSTETLFDVVDQLSALGIESLVFKGPAVAHDLYPDPELRLYRDVDLLIHEGDVSRAASLMKSMGFTGPSSLPPAQTRGFRRYAGQYQYFEPTRGVVEIHWALIQPVYAIDLDHDRLWANAREVDLGKRMLRTFDPDDTLLHLCAHGGKENWNRLKWVCDVARSVERYPDRNWPTLLRHAERRGYKRILLLGIALAEEFMAQPAPPPLRSAIDEDRALPELIDRVRRHLTETREDAPDNWKLSRFRWRSRERWRDRIVYFVRTTTTPWEWHYRLIRLPGWLFWGYYPIRILTDYFLVPIWIVVKRFRARFGTYPH